MHSSIQKHSLFSGFPWNFSLAQVLSRCAVQSSTRSMVSGPRCVWRGLHHWSFFLWTFWAVSVLGGKLKKPSAMKTNSVMNGEAMPCFTSSGGRRASHHVFVLEPSGWIFTSRLSTYMSTKSSPVPWPTGSIALNRGKTQIAGCSHNPKPWCTF